MFSIDYYTKRSTNRIKKEWHIILLSLYQTMYYKYHFLLFFFLKVETKENDGILLLAGGIDGKSTHAKDVARCALDLIRSCKEHSLEDLSKEISLEIGEQKNIYISYYHYSVFSFTPSFLQSFILYNPKVREDRAYMHSIFLLQLLGIIISSSSSCIIIISIILLPVSFSHQY